MYRTPSEQDKVHINFLMDSGGLGDLIGSIPAINYVYKHHPHVIAHLWVPDFAFELTKRSLPNDINRLVIRPHSMSHKYNDKFYGRCVGKHIHTNLGTHQTKHAFSTLVNTEVELDEMNYLSVDTKDVDVSKFNLPAKYIVMSTGFTSPVREFLPKHVNKVSEYIVSKGYSPIFLGRTESSNGAGHIIKGQFKEDINYSLGINIIDKTSLLETHKIISGAKTIVGLDNGLLHLAGTTEIPIVGGFTTVAKEHRMPIRHGEIGWNFYPVEVSKEKLACIGCQSNFQFTYNHNFTSCFYDDYACLELLNSDLYIEQLEKII